MLIPKSIIRLGISIATCKFGIKWQSSGFETSTGLYTQMSAHYNCKSLGIKFPTLDEENKMKNEKNLKRRL